MTSPADLGTVLCSGKVLHAEGKSTENQEKTNTTQLDPSGTDKPHTSTEGSRTPLGSENRAFTGGTNFPTIPQGQSHNVPQLHNDGIGDLSGRKRTKGTTVADRESD